MKIWQMESELQEWHREKYGRIEIDTAKTMRKFGEEVGEFIEAVMVGNPANIAEEAADVMFVMSHIVRQFAECGALEGAVEKKIQTVFARINKEGKLKATITIEDIEDGRVHVGCDFGDEGITDATKSTAAWLALEMMKQAGALAKGPEVEDFNEGDIEMN